MIYFGALLGLVASIQNLVKDHPELLRQESHALQA